MALRNFWPFPKSCQIVQIDVKGIKCDMPGCGWRDDTVRSLDYRAWLNKPCPVCNGNLLTERDHTYFIIFERVTAVMNWLLLPVGVFSSLKARITKKPANVHLNTVELDGTGAKGVRIVDHGPIQG